ncbi:MAG: chemotaxis-specific protein-glutamate methyltransferase CheB [Candidatus Eisenbacteria sp.]|nr:chemotaxis-specific protein-glutamate methyltransferase CheB [Candidatus Eisenbacteria bacterium]
MPIGILIVDDSAIYRKILSDVAASLPRVGAVKAVSSGRLALTELSQNHYALVLLDHQMPEMDGLETLTRIRQDSHDVAVVMVSAATDKGSVTAIKALNLGALEVIAKPQGKNAQENFKQLQKELSPVIEMVEDLQDRGVGRAPAAAFRAPTSQRLTRASVHTHIRPAGFAILAIGSSTGGPQALSHIIPRLPEDFPLPVAIVQHMPPIFTNALAKDLDRKSSLHVKEAVSGDRVVPGTVLIAPGGIHIVIRNGTNGNQITRFDNGPPENSCKPSVDVLFRSIAIAYRSKNVLSVILTGMGADGMRGVQQLKENNCYCITQAANTCVVYGMPQAVDKAALSDESLTLENLAARIIRLAGRGGR